MSHIILHINLKSTGEDNRGQKLECAKHLESIESAQLHAGKNINCKVISIFFFLPTRFAGDSESFERLLRILEIYLKSKEASTFIIQDFWVACIQEVDCSPVMTVVL